MIRAFAPVLDIDKGAMDKMLDLHKLYDLPIIAKKGKSVLVLVY